MKCSKCGKEYEGNFCPYCGTPANPDKELCPVCGKEREEGKRYCRNCGHDFNSVNQKNKKAGAGALAKIKRVPKQAWILAAVLIIIIIAVVITVTILNNKFRLGVVEQIRLGSSKERVIDILGEPYDYDEDDSVFTYFSDNYRKLLEENDNFNPDDIEDWEDFENAFGDALELEQKLQTEEYQYIEVRFDSEGTVTSVFFDAARTEQTKNQAKAIESYEVLSDPTSIYVTESVQYAAHYTDGSYYMAKSETSLNIENEIYTVNWRDRYGDDCEYQFSKNSVNNSEYDSTTHTLIIFTDNGFVDIPKDVENVIIYDSVTSIGNSAFYNCTSLTSITIPDSVTSIGENAFFDCRSLTSLTIPNSVTSIGEYAFGYCDSLTSITIPDSVTSIGELAFNGRKSVVEGTIPTIAIDYIPKGNLQAVTITSGTSIGEYAFGYCDSLTSITIPDSVTSIGVYAFSGCTNLIQTENDVSYVDRWAIDCDAYATSVILRSNTAGIADEAFYGCTLLTSLTIPDSVTSIGNKAFYNCDSLTSITIPDGVTSIGERAFIDCSSLTSITIPDSVTSIGSDAFWYCTSLTSVTIGNGVSSIGNAAFSGCRSLTSVTIPDGVTSIGNEAFSGCRSLTSVTIPDGVNSISREAFEYCTSLTNVTIPDSVTYIGSYAFNGCSALETVYYTGTEEQWNEIDIGLYNTYLRRANIIYNYEG